MSLEQLLEADTRVNLGGVQFGMAEDLLDGADVRSGVVHQCGHRVAEDVAGAGLSMLAAVM